MDVDRHVVKLSLQAIVYHSIAVVNHSTTQSNADQRKLVF